MPAFYRGFYFYIGAADDDDSNKKLLIAKKIKIIFFNKNAMHFYAQTNSLFFSAFDATFPNCNFFI